MTYRDELSAALHRATALEMKVKQLEEARARDRERIASLEKGQQATPAVLEELRITVARKKELEKKVDKLNAQLNTLDEPVPANARMVFMILGVLTVFLVSTFVCVPS